MRVLSFAASLPFYYGKSEGTIQPDEVFSLVRTGHPRTPASSGGEEVGHERWNGITFTSPMLLRGPLRWSPMLACGLRSEAAWRRPDVLSPASVKVTAVCRAFRCFSLPPSLLPSKHRGSPAAERHQRPPVYSALHPAVYSASIISNAICFCTCCCGAAADTQYICRAI